MVITCIICTPLHNWSGHTIDCHHPDGGDTKQKTNFIYIISHKTNWTVGHSAWSLSSLALAIFTFFVLPVHQWGSLKLYLVITMVGAFLTSNLEVEQSLDIYACGAPANSVSLKFWTTHLNLENIYWNKIFCGWMCLVIWPVVWLVAGLRVGALPHGELLLGLGHGEAAPADRVPDQQRVRVIQPPLDTRYINIDI